MPTLYVKNGTWSGKTPLYSSIDAAFDASTAGDTIKVSDLHSFTPIANWVLTTPTGTSTNPLKVVCVSDTDESVLSTGASEGSSSQFLTAIEGGVYFYGIKFIHTSDIGLSPAAGGEGDIIFDTCINEATGSGAGIDVSSIVAPYQMNFYNHTIDSDGSAFEFPTNFIGRIDNLTITGATLPTYVFTYTGGSIWNITLTNSDLSNLGSGSYILNRFGEIYGIINIERCKLSASTGFVETPTSGSGELNVYSCDVGNGYSYFHYVRTEGQLYQQLSIYRNDGAKIDGIPFSSESTTTTLASYVNPLRVPLGTYSVDLSSAKILTWHTLINDDGDTAVPADLYNSEVWIEVDYNDATNKALGQTATSKGGDVLTVGSSYTTLHGASTASWTGEKTINKRKNQIAVDLSANGMVNSQVRAFLCVARDFTTAGDSFFVCPNPVVS